MTPNKKEGSNNFKKKKKSISHIQVLCFMKVKITFNIAYIIICW